MADQNDAPANGIEPDDAPRALRPRTRRTGVTFRRASAPAARTAAPAGSASAPRKRSAAKPIRSLAILTVVGGLVATVALPAYGVWQSETDPVTIQQVAAEGAQTLVVASEADAPGLERESYAATTQEEIDDEIAKEKAEKAAAERARAAAAAAAASAASSGGSSTFNTDFAMAAGSGAVRWPLGNFVLGDGFRARGGSHMGIDMLASGGTPIYAAADGVVRVSQESYGGYGVAITIDHVVGGQRMTTLYGHMIYGSRRVGVGQTVQAGQVIGLVGTTGRSTANHLHFETYLNGSNIDPWSWLQSNAG